MEEQQSANTVPGVQKKISKDVLSYCTRLDTTEPV